MAKQASCHGCVYAYWDRALWLREQTRQKGKSGARCGSAKAR